MDTVTHTAAQAACSAESPKTVGLWAQASDTRRRARAVLGGHSGAHSHRLTLVLSLVIILAVSVALVMAVSCLSVAGYILFEDAVWVEPASGVLLAVLFLGLVLPLVASVWRLACLMTAPDGEVVDGLPVSVPAATLGELFYPFTSLRAYGRTMAVAMEGLGFAVLSVGVPILCFRLVLLSCASLADSSPFLYALLAVGAFLLCLALGLLVFFLSGSRAGFGYFVFTHDTLSLSDIHRYYRGFRRPLMPAFCLRVSLIGWYALSAVCILVPFLIHAAPYGLCCAAAYSRSLCRR